MRSAKERKRTRLQVRRAHNLVPGVDVDDLAGDAAGGGGEEEGGGVSDLCLGDGPAERGGGLDVLDHSGDAADGGTGKGADGAGEMALRGCPSGPISAAR